MIRRIVLLGLVTTLAACSKEAPVPPPPPSVLVQTVADGAGEQLRVFTGEVVPRHASDLGFRVGGKLIERQVDVGDAVTRGQVLARLDGTDMKLNVSAARAQVAAAQSDLELARTELKRVETLLARNFVSDSAVDSQRTSSEAAAARLRQARAQLELAENQTEYTSLQADADGVVTAVHAEAGQVMAAGSPVVTIAREGDREVRINVPEGLQDALAPGRAAQVRLWSEGEKRLAGQVRELAPSADAVTRTYAVKVTVDAPVAQLPLGATATVVFDGGALAGVRVPMRAVGTFDGQPAAWVFDEAQGVVKPVAVTVLRYDEAGAVISAGLEPGMKVVVAGIHLLQPGQQVKAVPAEAAIELDASR